MMKTKQLKPLTSAFSVSCWRLNPRNRKQLNCLVGPVAPASRRLLLSPRANAGGSPAVRGQRLCYHHGRVRPPARMLPPGMPDVRDERALLHWIMRSLLRRELDVDTAGKLIYGIQVNRGISG